MGLASLPFAARGPVSATLGADDPAYAIRPSGASLTARTPTQKLTESFGSARVAVRAGKTRLGLTLESLSYGSVTQAIGPVAPRRGKTA